MTLSNLFRNRYVPEWDFDGFALTLFGQSRDDIAQSGQRSVDGRSFLQTRARGARGISTLAACKEDARNEHEMVMRYKVISSGRIDDLLFRFMIRCTIYDALLYK